MGTLYEQTFTFMMSKTQNVILIIGPSWVGDMMMAQSLFKTLKQRQPTPEIDVLAPVWSAGLLQRMPEVRHIHTHDIGHGKLVLQVRHQMGYQLRECGYQQAIVLPNAWKAALIPFWANISIRTGFTGELRYGLLNDLRKKNKKLLAKTVEQFVALGLPPNQVPVDIPPPTLQPQSPTKILQKLQLNSDLPILALCPGAEYGESKRWPPEYFATVAHRYIQTGWQVWLFGSSKDQAVGETIQRQTGQFCNNLCGKTTLSEVVDLLALTKVVITNDSGLMHIAAALDKPMIAIYGSSNPAMTPPLSPKAHILSLNLACSPCFQRSCRYQHFNCLRELTPKKVLYALENYI